MAKKKRTAKKKATKKKKKAVKSPKKTAKKEAYEFRRLGIETYDVMKDEVKQKAKQSEQWVKKNPGKSVAIAAGIGFIFAKIFGRRRR